VALARISIPMPKELDHVLLNGFGMMTKYSIAVLVFSLLLCLTVKGQSRRETEQSVVERARRLEPTILESARHYGIDPRILWQMCLVESRFRVDAISPKGARGPMQFMPETAVRYRLKNPHDPKSAIDAGAHYLRDLLSKFDGRIDLALAAYNAGEGAVESFRTGKPLVTREGKVLNPRGLITGGIPPYSETQAYVKSILISLTSYEPSDRASTLKTGSGSWRISSRTMTLSATSHTAAKKDRALNSFIEVDQ